LWEYLEVSGSVRRRLKQQPPPFESDIDGAMEPLTPAKEALIRNLSRRYCKL